MRKFSFTLEPVRRIREQEEQLVQVELAAAMRDRAAVLERLEESRRAEQQLHEYVRSGTLTSAELQHIARYDELHRQKIVDATVQLKYADDGIERIRIRLAEARVRREALDRLHERRLEEHRREQLAEEARELDEIGSMRRGLAAAHGEDVVVAS